MKQEKNNAEPLSGKSYWRSLSQVRKSPEFQRWSAGEFPEGTAELTEEEAQVSRRNFLKLMGASLGLAGTGLASCRRPETYLVPFSKQVEWAIPGKALYYSTCMPHPLWGAVPLVVTSYDGRPTHLQGNKLHPACNGGVDAMTQASVLNLYDPDRSQKYLQKGKGVKKAEFQDFFEKWKAEVTPKSGKGVGFLINPSTSPTRQSLIRKIQQSPEYSKARWYAYEPISTEGYQGAVDSAFGKTVALVPQVEKADKILTFEADILGVEPPTPDAIGQFARRRKVDHKEENPQGMNRLYTIESHYTVTGGMADHRLPLNGSQMLVAAAVFAKALGDESGDGKLSSLAENLLKEADVSNIDPKWFQIAAKDFLASKGKSLVIAGVQMPGELHALCFAINKNLKNFGSTIQIVKREKPAETYSIEALEQDVQSEKIHTLITLTDTDPSYDFPSGINWQKVQEKLALHINLGFYENAMARNAHWHIPSTHYLESWGDAVTPDGIYSIQQQMILPLYGGVSQNDFLLQLFSQNFEEQKEQEASPVYQAVRAVFVKRFGAEAKTWEHALRDGYVVKSAYAQINKTPKAKAIREILSKAILPPTPKADSIELTFTPSASVWDGRYANNGWLQEAPDPITKLTWDNAALISPRTAKKLHLKDSQVLEINHEGNAIKIAALLCPGHADNALTLALGYGQNPKNGRVLAGVGVNAYPLRKNNATSILSGAKIKVTNEKYPLALTQEHHHMEGRALAREGTLNRYEKHHDFAQKEGMDHHIPPNNSLYEGPEFDYEKYPQWGMTIDLNQCIGCSSCTVSCQSENNIPIVGKEQVIKGREMHWIRLDRYFATEDGANPEEDPNPEMLPQPVACVQCENAPCETVCPVNATVHDEMGLNTMAYNRCIGTRYCANNCPYKARRFNFFDYNKRTPLVKHDGIFGSFNNLYLGPLGERHDDEATKLQKNPNVTVRMRGVMEKCTYCVQRIQNARIDQKITARDSSDTMPPTGAVKTACQESCPAEAIVFGNLADAKSPIIASKASPRNYDLLSYIGTLPRTSYLARIKNPNPKMPNSRHIGQATINIL